MAKTQLHFHKKFARHCSMKCHSSRSIFDSVNIDSPVLLDRCWSFSHDTLIERQGAFAQRTLTPIDFVADFNIDFIVSFSSIQALLRYQKDLLSKGIAKAQTKPLPNPLRVFLSPPCRARPQQGMKLQQLRSCTAISILSTSDSGVNAINSNGLRPVPLEFPFLVGA